MKKYSILFLLVLPVFLMTGCSSSSHKDLVQYMQEVRERPAAQIEPIPTFDTYTSFVYAAAGSRSPFEEPVEIVFVLNPDGSKDISSVTPDETRVKEFLETFSISAITMVGSISRGDEFYALVNDGTDNIHRVKEGNYMGRNHGRIVLVDNLSINLVEIVPNGVAGWLERPKAIKLIESDVR